MMDVRDTLTDCLSHAPNPGTLPAPQACADWESNQQPFGSQVGTQSTEPYQPGQTGISWKHFITTWWLTAELKNLGFQDVLGMTLTAI